MTAQNLSHDHVTRTTIEDLPDESPLHIFSYVPNRIGPETHEDVCRNASGILGLRHTCGRFRLITKELSIWFPPEFDFKSLITNRQHGPGLDEPNFSAAVCQKIAKKRMWKAKGLRNFLVISDLNPTLFDVEHLNNTM
jgi:hypothetical protein